MVKECRQPVLEEQQADGFIRQLYEVPDSNMGEWKYKSNETGEILTHEEYMEKQDDSPNKKTGRQVEVPGATPKDGRKSTGSVRKKGGRTKSRKQAQG